MNGTTDEPAAVALLRGPLSKRATSAEFNEWQARDVVAYIDRILAASPIVTAPEGWRRAFLAYVEPEDAFTQLAIALCRADGNNPDATVSVDGGPMQRHWHYYAEEARTMLLAIPEGKAEPVIWLQFNATDGFTGLRRWTRDKDQAARWIAEDDAHKYRFEAYGAPVALSTPPGAPHE